MTTNKWGALASFLLAISFLVAPLIYLMGNLRDAMGIFAYDLADFLYGPVLSASLITVTYALREQPEGLPSIERGINPDAGYSSNKNVASEYKRTPFFLTRSSIHCCRYSCLYSIGFPLDNSCNG